MDDIAPLENDMSYPLGNEKGRASCSALIKGRPTKTSLSQDAGIQMGGVVVSKAEGAQGPDIVNHRKKYQALKLRITALLPLAYPGTRFTHGSKKSSEFSSLVNLSLVCLLF